MRCVCDRCCVHESDAGLASEAIAGMVGEIDIPFSKRSSSCVQRARGVLVIQLLEIAWSWFYARRAGWIIIHVPCWAWHSAVHLSLNLLPCWPGLKHTRGASVDLGRTCLMAGSREALWMPFLDVRPNRPSVDHRGFRPDFERPLF